MHIMTWLRQFGRRGNAEHVLRSYTTRNSRRRKQKAQQPDEEDEERIRGERFIQALEESVRQTSAPRPAAPLVTRTATFRTEVFAPRPNRNARPRQQLLYICTST